MSGLQSPARAGSLPLLGAGIVRVMPALLVGILLWALLFIAEIGAAVETWTTSTAYGHCFLVLPMALFLIWERRSIALSTPVRPSLACTALALPIAFGWLFAERLGIMEGRQLMAIAALEVIILAVLGQRMFRVLTGPLLYLFFLVPFGMFLTPSLQQFTARFTAIGLDLLGITHYADDLVIEIPAGTFLVAEACAGLRFLIASIAFGVFYALLNYRSPVRRAAFILASIALPIVANGFRALGIVVLGNILGSAQAATADHIIYGWVFFSLVMLLLVVAGLPLRESVSTNDARGGGLAPARPGPVALWVAIIALLVTAVGPSAARLLDLRAVPVPLATAPELQALPGCRWSGDSPPRLATRVVRHLGCEDVDFDVVIQSFPAGSTAAGLRAEEIRLSGEVGAEDTSFLRLPAGEGGGIWTLAQSYEPFQAVAMASWVDGQPASTGLASRLQLARDSMLGTRYPPVLITVAVTEAQHLKVDARRNALDRLRALIGAQTGLTEPISAITRP